MNEHFKETEDIAKEARKIGVRKFDENKVNETGFIKADLHR